MPYTGICIFLLISISLLILLTLKNNHISESFEEENMSKYFTEDKHKRYPPYETKKDTIFVSIASYRDFECSKTVQSLFENANEPNNIFVGICSQNSSSPDEECLPDNFKYSNNIRIHKLKHTEALGPTYARYLCSHLWKGEEFYLQIDSHILFDKNWDKTILNMYKQLPHKKCGFVGYPPNYGQNPAENPSYICSSHFEKINDQEGTFDIVSEARIISKPDRKGNAFMTPYFSAGFFFCNASFLYDVPYDPYLPYLFQGEEPLMAIRLYTSGWDMYNIPVPICTHNYADHETQNDQARKPKFWSDNSHINWQSIQNCSKKRYFKIIGQNVKCKPESLIHINYYGLGNQRTPQEYYDFAGINVKDKQIESRCNSKYDAKLKKWIPMTEINTDNKDIWKS